MRSDSRDGSYVKERMPFIGLHNGFSLLILKMSKRGLMNLIERFF